MPKSWTSEPCRTGVAALAVAPSACTAASAAPSCDPADVSQLSPSDILTAPDGERANGLDALFNCLASPDPGIRDAIAYEGLVEIMRSGDLQPAEARTLLERSLAAVRRAPGADTDGVYRPFAMLILAEAVRADRVSAYMTPDERSAALDTVITYLSDLTDYRGFDPAIGWRHGVAHSADALLQIVLNPEYGAAAHRQILDVIADKAATADHAYVFGEPRRLARPVLYIALAGTISEQDWQAWFEALAAPAPLESWDLVWMDEKGLRRLHNLRAFLLSLQVSAANAGDQRLEPLAALSLSALSTLP